MSAVPHRPGPAAIASLSDSQKARLLQRLRSEDQRRRDSNGAAPSAPATQLAVYLTLEENAPRPGRELIEQWLRERLPGYMVPSAIRILDRLPTNANGKIDKAALSRSAANLDAQEPFSPSFADIPTQLLLAIWERVLNIRPVQETHNFFELGGDSILAIQVISEARKAGLPLRVSQLFSHPTVQGLVSCLASPLSPKSGSQEIPAGAGILTTGELTIPFTPIQQWFFENRFSNPHHWNQSFLLHMDAKIPFAAVKEAFGRLYESHDALRLAIQERPTSLTQIVLDRVELPIQHWPIRMEELSFLQSEAAIIRQTANAIQTRFHLSEGRLLRASFFSADNEEPNKLLLIGHHLCVDAISWKVIFDELAGQLASRSETTESGVAGDRFARWASALPDAARRFQGSLGFWRNQPYYRCPSVPLDHGELGLNLEGSARSATVTLSESQTQALLAKASTRENSLQTFLVASLALTLSEWLGAPWVLIGIEGHGRGDVVPGADTADAVGWFTSYFPVVLDLRYADSPEQALLDVQSQLAQVPDHGHSYGLLRYAHPDREVRDQLAQVPHPQVTFNYLGKAAGPSVKAPFSAVEYGIGVDRDPDNRRTSIFEINAGMVDGRLKVDFQYSDAVHSPGTIEKLSQRVAAVLDRVASPPRSAQPPLKAGAERHLEPTGGQQALLLHRLGSPAHDLGELTLSGHLVGSVSVDRVQAAWDEIVARHPALRATVHWRDQEAPVLEIHRAPRPSVETIDLTHLPDADQARELSRLIAQKRSEPLDIGRLPSTGLTLLKRSDDRCSFIWRCHHVFLDGWSSSLVLKELLARLASGASPGDGWPDASACFYSYYDWLASIPPSEPGRFWSDYVQGCEPCLVIPGAGERQAQPGFQRRATAVHQPGNLGLGALRAAAARYRATPGVLALAAWGIVLANLTRRGSVCFGLTHSGRNAPISHAEAIVGNLANLVPFRIQCDPQADVSQWIQQLMEQQERVSRHGHISLDRIARWAHKSLEFPLFDTTLAIANYPGVNSAGAVRLEGFEGDTTSTFPVSISLSLSDSLSILIDYDESALSNDGVRYLLALYTRILEGLCTEVAPTLSAFLQSSTALEFRKLMAAARGENQPSAGAGANGPQRGRSDQRPGPQTAEERLLAIFRETLSQPEAGPEDNFFDLGGTSIQALRLFHAIERLYHKRLPLSSLFQHPTAAALSALLGSPAADQPFRSLVEIRRGDNRLPPLFLIHAGGLEVLFYKDLADHLDPQLPVYGIQSVGLDGRERPLEDIRESAGRYLREMQSLHPRSPYFIAGHCYGIVVALEMAVQLRNRNFDVPLLISVDGPALRMTSRFERPDPQPKPAFLERVTGKLRREFAYYRAGPEGRREILRKRIQSAYVLAVRNYRTSPYLGRVLHLKCRDAEETPNQSDLAWKQAAPNVHIQSLGCTHAEILQKPHVVTVADAILRELNACYFAGALQRPGPAAPSDQR